VCKSKKVIPLQAWTGPKDSRRLRIPDFKTIGTLGWYGCQPHELATFTVPSKYSWYSFLLEAESTRGPKCGRKDYVNDTIKNRTCDLPACSAVPQPNAPSRAPYVEEYYTKNFIWNMNNGPQNNISIQVFVLGDVYI
jgi:hypothetical protein